MKYLLSILPIALRIVGLTEIGSEKGQNQLGLRSMDIFFYIETIRELASLLKAKRSICSEYSAASGVSKCSIVCV